MTTLYPLAFNDVPGDIKTALETHYGAGVTVHYYSDTEIVFTCGAICDKVVRITISLSGQLMRPIAYTGDAWTSGTTITNSVRFSNVAYSSSAATAGDELLILSDNFLVLSLGSNLAGYRGTMILAKTSLNRFICLGGYNGNNSSYASCTPYYTDNRTQTNLALQGLSHDCAVDGKHLTIPSYISVANVVQVNTDNEIEYIAGLYMTGIDANSTFMYGPNFIMLPPIWGGTVVQFITDRCLYIPLTV